MYKYGNGRLRKCLALLALLLLSHCDESLAGSVTGVTNVRQTKFDECSARPLTIKESELQVALGFDQGTKLSPDNLQGLIQKFVTSALGNGEANSASTALPLVFMCHDASGFGTRVVTHRFQARPPSMKQMNEFEAAGTLSFFIRNLETSTISEIL